MSDTVNMYHVPSGGLHAVSLPYPMEEDHARKFVRGILDVKRLPNGTAFWYNRPIRITNYE
jgi:hypothetical protein